MTERDDRVERVARAIGLEIARAPVEPRGGWLRAARAAITETEQWEKIETAPTGAGNLILLSRPDGIASIGYFDGVEQRWHDCYGEMQPPPTHWMPLPQPPGGDNE
jgi:hypothetical protein